MPELLQYSKKNCNFRARNIILSSPSKIQVQLLKYQKGKSILSIVYAPKLCFDKKMCLYTQFQRNFYNYYMLSNPNLRFDQLVGQLLIDKRYEAALIQGEKLYQIRQYNVLNLTPVEVTSIYYQISAKFYEKLQESLYESWYENQLRIFIWLLIGFCFLEGRDVSKMKFQDWEIFRQIFNGRPRDLFQFQALTILKRQRKCLKWSQNESQLLAQIIETKQIKNRWNEIAREMYVSSNRKYFRTAKQCRQHWINHLDPSPLRTNWSLQEDVELLKSVLKHGKKWSKISKNFEGKRTQHMVKNRYKSLLHFEKKKNKVERVQLSDKKITQLLLQSSEVHLNTFKQYNRKQDNAQINFLQSINEIQIQSAEMKSEKIGLQPEYHIQNQLFPQLVDIQASKYQRDNVFQSNRNASPKCFDQNFEILLQSDKENSIFHDCFNLFMSQDFNHNFEQFDP